MLGDFTGRAYQRALDDYGRRDPWRREGLPPWGAFRDLVEIRGHGEVSDGTFWRVMHVLYDNSREFIHYLDGDSRKPALKLLCGLLDDGGQRAPHRPANTLGEAVADYSRTARAAGLCDLWRRAAAGEPRSRRFVRGFADFFRRNNEPPPPFEALACAWDRSLRWRTYRMLGRRGSRGRYDGVAPEWPAGEPADLAVSESGAAEGSEEVYSPEVRDLVKSEGARLPAELRGAFYRVVARMYVNGLHRAVDADAEAAGRPPEMPSLYLRLIAEIIRNWGWEKGPASEPPMVSPEVAVRPEPPRPYLRR